MKRKTTADETSFLNSTPTASNGKTLAVFKWLSFFFFIYVLPIVLSDLLYKDDIRRVIYGDPSTWYRDGRPIMALILNSFSFGTPIFDTAPLPLLTGIAFLSVSATLFYKKYLQNYDCLSAVLCLLMLIISPFFLENLSFRFESLGMSATLGLFLILFSLPDRINKGLTFALSLLITVCVSCLYQAALGAFFSLLFLTVFLELQTIPLKTCWENALYKLAGFGIGFFIYMARIAPLYVAKEGYQAEHSGLVSMTAEGLTKCFTNLKDFLFDLKLMYFPRNNTFISVLSAAVIFFALIAIVIYVKELLSNSQDRSRYGKAFLGIILPVLIITFAFIPMCFLANPNFSPRVFISFNISLLFIGILLVSLTKKSRLILLIFIPIYFFSYSFSYTYANLLKSQAAYEIPIAQSVVHDLNKIEGIDGSFKFYIEGKPVIAKDVLLATNRYPRIFGLLIPKYLQKNNVYACHLLSRYSTYRIDVYTLGKFNPNDYKIVTKNSLYRILQNKKDIVIEFLSR